MSRTRKFSINLSGVIFLLFLIESVAAQTSDLRTFAESEIPDELTQNVIPAKINERETSENETIKNYKSALTASPENAVLYNNLGVQYVLIYRYEEAYKALKKSIELDSASADAFYNLSKVAELLGRESEALGFVRQALSLDGKNKRSNIQLCRLLTISAYHSEAVKCYGNLSTIFTPDADVIAAYGIALINAGNPEKASIVLGEKNNLYGDDKSVQNALGVLYFTKKKYKRAVKYFVRAVELAPDFQAAHFNLAIAQLNKKDKKGAFDQYVILKKSNVKLAEKLYRYMYSGQVLYVNGK